MRGTLDGARLPRTGLILLALCMAWLAGAPTPAQEAVADAPPDAHGARGYGSPPSPPGSGAGWTVGRILLFPARVGIQVATFPMRTLGGALSSTGLLQRMARGHAVDRYFAPVVGVDPSLGRNAGFRGAHPMPFDRQGCVTYRVAFGGTKEQIYAITVRSRDARLIPQRPGWAYRLTAKYEIIPDKQFFGLGNLSRRDHRTYYTQERYLFLGTLRYAPTAWLRWDLTLAHQRRQLTHAAYVEGAERSIEERFLPSIYGDPGTAPGLGVDPQNVQAELALIVDRRDAPGRPTSGWRAEGFCAYVHGTGADGVSFVRYGGEGTAYLRLADRHVLALRAAGEEARTSQTDPAGRAYAIKFPELPSLGGRSTLRGYLDDRFTDNAALCGTAEYRYGLSPLVELCAFADFGKVLPRLLDFDLEDIYRSWGAGVRVARSETFYFRLYGAFSDENYVVSATLEPIFERFDRRERR